MCDFPNDWKWFTYSTSQVCQSIMATKNLTESWGFEVRSFNPSWSNHPCTRIYCRNTFHCIFHIYNAKIHKIENQDKNFIQWQENGHGGRPRLDSTNQHDILWQVVIPILYPANLYKSSVPSLMFTKFCLPGNQGSLKVPKMEFFIKAHIWGLIFL